MTVPPLDDWSPEQWRSLGIELPAEPPCELSEPHIRFYAWLVYTGRLQGDTPPRPEWPFDHLAIPVL